MHPKQLCDQIPDAYGSHYEERDGCEVDEHDESSEAPGRRDGVAGIRIEEPQ